MNIFNQFLKSIYSPKDIAKFRFQGIGKTILYVFSLTFISILPTTYHLISAINNGMDVTRETLNKDVPPLIIENGQLSLESNSPVIIEKDEFKIILDDTGTIEPNEFAASENVIALLKNEFLFIAGGRAQSYNYAMLTDMKITNQDLLDFLQTIEGLKIIFLPVIFLIIYIFSSGIKFIEVSILALIGLFITNMLKRNVPYRQSWRMAAYSVTLPTLFFAIMATLQTVVPNGFLINWVVSIVVLTLSLKEIPMKKPKVEAP
jgi:hypothetical protein